MFNLPHIAGVLTSITLPAYFAEYYREYVASHLPAVQSCSYLESIWNYKECGQYVTQALENKRILGESHKWAMDYMNVYSYYYGVFIASTAIMLFKGMVSLCKKDSENHFNYLTFKKFLCDNSGIIGELLIGFQMRTYFAPVVSEVLVRDFMPWVTTSLSGIASNSIWESVSSFAGQSLFVDGINYVSPYVANIVHTVATANLQYNTYLLAQTMTPAMISLASYVALKCTFYALETTYNYFSSEPIADKLEISDKAIKGIANENEISHQANINEEVSGMAMAAASA